MQDLQVRSVISLLKSYAVPGAKAGMARYGIRAKRVLGVPASSLHRLARQLGKNHRLAQRLWASGIYDARILAALIDDESRVTQRQMDTWASDFDNWAICDGCCIHLFVYTPNASKKALLWSGSKKEFVKRAGFTLMASLAIHDKEATNSLFKKFLAIIERESTDNRHNVKKGVNWALRQIGKRNKYLNWCAVQTAYRLKQVDASSARWIASDALRELTSDAVRLRLQTKRPRK